MSADPDGYTLTPGTTGTYCNEWPVFKQGPGVDAFNSLQGCADWCTTHPRCEYFSQFSDKGCNMYNKCRGRTGQSVSTGIYKRVQDNISTTPEECAAKSKSSLCTAIEQCQCKGMTDADDTECKARPLGSCASADGKCYWAPEHYPACWAQVRNAMGYTNDANGFAEWMVVNYFNCHTSGLFTSKEHGGTGYGLFQGQLTIQSVSGTGFKLCPALSRFYTMDENGKQDGADDQYAWNRTYHPWTEAPNVDTGQFDGQDFEIFFTEMSVLTGCATAYTNQGNKYGGLIDAWNRLATSDYWIGATDWPKLSDQITISNQNFNIPENYDIDNHAIDNWGGGPYRLTMPVFGFAVTFQGPKTNGVSNIIDAFWLAQNVKWSIDGLPGDGTTTFASFAERSPQNKEYVTKFVRDNVLPGNTACAPPDPPQRLITDCCLQPAETANPVCTAAGCTQRSATCDTEIGKMCPPGKQDVGLCYCMGDDDVVNPDDNPYTDMWNKWPKDKLPDKDTNFKRCFLGACMNDKAGAYIPSNMVENCPSICASFASIKSEGDSTAIGKIVQNASCQNGTIDLNGDTPPPKPAPPAPGAGSPTPGADSPPPDSHAPSSTRPRGSLSPGQIACVVVAVVGAVLILGVVITHFAVKSSRRMVKSEIQKVDTTPSVDLQDDLQDDFD